ncbi:Pancreatic triacylglycerol lipase [Frankliniella fusca]|uniref:Pancreatic triacylglycerol lipase n=1 Tax=Frankliniella fusca TaxID=407009 RepID=A0AAE1HJD9_9NEOP|nr:Pancreatic triacylglycerol lipase [Frankliniella fusca]
MNARAPLAALLLVIATATLATASSSCYKFYFYNKNNAGEKRGNLIASEFDKQDILDAGYDPALPTKVLIHGFLNDDTSAAVQVLKNAYFEADPSVNVIAFNWDNKMNPIYGMWVLKVAGAGQRLADLVDFMVENELLKLDQLHLVGHSLGAHVAAVAGERLTSGRLARITGLDAAGPLINFFFLDGRLSKDDADLVDVIHTNGGGLGAVHAVGHVDFYPNGGVMQPGCRWDMSGSCSHGRSYQLMAESIVDPKAFQAWKCGDNKDAVHRRCSNSKVYAFMGEKVDFSEEGSYYLETKGGLNGPFSRAIDTYSLF